MERNQLVRNATGDLCTEKRLGSIDNHTLIRFLSIHKSNRFDKSLWSNFINSLDIIIQSINASVKSVYKQHTCDTCDFGLSDRQANRQYINSVAFKAVGCFLMKKIRNCQVTHTGSMLTRFKRFMYFQLFKQYLDVSRMKIRDLYRYLTQFDFLETTARSDGTNLSIH